MDANAKSPGLIDQLGPPNEISTIIAVLQAFHEA